MKMDTEELNKFLMEDLKREVEKRWSDNYSGFEEASPPDGQIITEKIAPWLWVKARIEYEGASWTPSTDRASGDPEDAHTWRDWIGLAESAPDKVSIPEELDNWALLSTTYSRTYRDIQIPDPWGFHSGRWVEALSEDGIVTVRVVTEERFQDVSPETKTTTEYIDLKNNTP